MSTYLFIVFLSFIINSLLIIPFINFLYHMRLQRAHQMTTDAFDKPTPIFDSFHRHKSGTPVGGGILIVASTVLVFFAALIVYFILDQKIIANYPSTIAEIKILLFTFLSFAFLGIYDDLNKIFFWEKRRFFGLRLRHKLIIEIVLALIVSYWLYADLKIGILNLPYVGVINMGLWNIPFAAFVIVAFANAVNITDGLDGLASGILMITMLTFWVIARSILDMPTSIFIAAWIGGLISFTYFNIYPARLFLGDTGALSFGATFAVVGLILGKAFALPIIGGVFVIEITSSLIQLLGKKYLHRKIFPVAPYHLLLQLKGWEEPKIVMRLWLISILFAVFGLMVAFAK